MTSGEDNWSVSLWDELACSAPYSICALMGGASDPNDISAYYDDECIPGRFHHGELRKKSNWDTVAMVLSRNHSGQLRSIYQLPRAASNVIHFCWAADILPWSGYCVAVMEPHNNAERYEKALRTIAKCRFDIYADEEVKDVNQVKFKRLPLKTGVSEDGHPRWIWTENKTPGFLEENQDIYLLAKFVDAFSPVFARNTTHLKTVAMDKAQVVLEILTNGLIEPFDTSIPFNWDDAPLNTLPTKPRTSRYQHCRSKLHLPSMLRITPNAKSWQNSGWTSWRNTA